LAGYEEVSNGQWQEKLVDGDDGWDVRWCISERTHGGRCVDDDAGWVSR
jgi:hypothetical protein